MFSLESSKQISDQHVAVRMLGGDDINDETRAFVTRYGGKEVPVACASYSGVAGSFIGSQNSNGNNAARGNGFLLARSDSNAFIEHGPEERPLIVHPVEQLAPVVVDSERLERGAGAVPTRDVETTLAPAEDPWDGP